MLLLLVGDLPFLLLPLLDGDGSNTMPIVATMGRRSIPRNHHFLLMICSSGTFTRPDQANHSIDLFVSGEKKMVWIWLDVSADSMSGLILLSVDANQCNELT